jgi:hypothetical protein
MAQAALSIYPSPLPQGLGTTYLRSGARTNVTFARAPFQSEPVRKGGRRAFEFQRSLLLRREPYLARLIYAPLARFRPSKTHRRSDSGNRIRWSSVRCELDRKQKE